MDNKDVLRSLKKYLSYVLNGVPNLLTNTSFETNTTGWSQNAASGSLTRDTTAGGAHSGLASGRQVNPGSNASEGFRVTTDVTVPTSTNYTLSCWLKGNGVSEAVSLSLGEYTSGASLVGTTTTNVVLTTNWQRVTVTRAFGATGTKARPIIRGTNTAAVTFYVDDLSLVNGTDAALSEIAADGPYDVNLVRDEFMVRPSAVVRALGDVLFDGPRHTTDIVQPFEIFVYPTNGFEGGEIGNSLAAYEVQRILSNGFVVGIDPGRAYRVPIWNYAGVSWNAASSGNPIGYARVDQFSAQTMVDAEDDTLFTVMANFRLTWRQTADRVGFGGDAVESTNVAGSLE